jgi:molybdopterin/thiamine biosynthesis adenylyltransferase/proteasome lid subunit RPN8/RPN11
MNVTLVMPDAIGDEIADRLTLPYETGGVLIVRRVDTANGIRLLARRICWVDDAHYLERDAVHMSIPPEGYLPALAQAEADGAIALWFHTHPNGPLGPHPSEADIEVDATLAETFRIRTSSNYYGTLIAAPGDRPFTFTGTLVHVDGSMASIDRVWLVGARWRMVQADGESDGTVADIFDRNVRAFGPAIQSILGKLVVAVTGAGGTGSAVAEQLVRLGVRHLILVDGDRLSLSNVTRVYGSTPEDIGRPKVDVLRDHLSRIAPDLRCETVMGMATMRAIAERLTAADLIFGCTDDNAGRLVLSRFATWLLTPLIDVGVLLTSGADGSLEGIHGRVTTVGPGNACLVCRNRIDLKRAAAELMTPEERTRLVNEGYAPALGQTEPAVVAFTTAVAAAAVNEMLDRLIGYGPPVPANETLLRIHEREISTNHAIPREGHYCHVEAGKWSSGQEEPFLGQLWPVT